MSAKKKPAKKAPKTTEGRARDLLRKDLSNIPDAAWGISKLHCLEAAQRVFRQLGADPVEVEFNIIDALANLRHLCDALGLDFAELDHLGYNHYADEKGTIKEFEARPPGVSRT